MAGKLHAEFRRRSGFFGKLCLDTSKVLHREAEVASRTTLARIAARCLDYRRDRGEFPRSLDEIDDGLDSVDPLSGRAFVLDRRQGRLVLSSPAEGVSWRSSTEEAMQQPTSDIACDRLRNRGGGRDRLGDRGRGRGRGRGGKPWQ